MAFDQFERMDSIEVKTSKKRWAITHRKYLLPDELDRLVVILGKVRISKRDRLILRLALSTGLRASELISLRKSDLLTARNSIFVAALKNGVDREMFLLPEFSLELARYAERVEDDRIFPIKYHCLTQRIWTKYRPVRKKFHSLRHTFAIRLYLETRDIKLVQTALGHRDIKNTMVYLDYCYSLEQMKRITAVAI